MPAPSITIGGITCWVDAEGQRESWPGEGGPEVRVTFKCAYADRYTVANTLMGTTTYAAGTLGGAFPFQYSRSTNLYAVSLGDIVGRGNARVNADGYWDYDWALIPCLFAVPRHQYDVPAGTDPASGFVDPSGQPMTTTTINVSADVVRPPKGSFYFVGSSPATAVDEGSLGFLFPQVEITLRRHSYPYLPLAEIMALAGGVNNSTMKIGNYTFPVETLLFASGPSEQQVDTLGRLTTSLEVKLIGRNQSWNKLPDKNGVWTNINTKADGTGQKPFRLVNFATLP